MPRRLCALALAVLLAFAPACASRSGGRTEGAGSGAAEAKGPSLPRGFYAVYGTDAASDKIGYLRVGYSRLTFYDAYGIELENLYYDLSAGGVIYSEGRKLYTLRQAGLDLQLSSDGGTSYRIVFLSETQLPEGGYAVYDAESNERLGFLRVSGGELAFFDGDKTELRRLPYRVSEEGLVSSQGETLYYARYGWGGLRLVNDAGREYILAPSDAAPE